MEYENMKSQIEQLISTYVGDVSIYAVSLRDHRILTDHHSTHQVRSASIIKILIMVSVLEQIAKNKYELTSMITVNQDQVLVDSEIFLAEERIVSIEELLTWMIAYSDNTSANVLIDLIGIETINKTITELNLTQTLLQRKMLDYEAIAEGSDNFTSALDMVIVFERIFGNSILTPILCEKVKEILLKQEIKDQFLRYITDDIQVFHKTGDLEYLNHNVGVFRINDQDYFLGVFCWNTVDIEGNKNFVGRVAQIFYEYMKTI